MLSRVVRYAALAAALWSGLAGSAARASGEFCAIKVHVTDTSGAGLTLPLALSNSEGKVVALSRTQDGQGEICDVGFGTHTLTIGRYEACHPVAIEGIRITGLQPLVFRVSLPFCMTSGDRVYVACFAHIRVADQTGKPIPAAKIDMDAHPGSIIADSYGRAMTHIDRDRLIRVRVTARGYSAAETAIDCMKPVVVEKLITLQRLR